VTNVELMAEFWGTWIEDGAETLLARYDEFFTEDAEWWSPSRELTGTRYVGRPGFEQYSYDVSQVLSDLRGEVEELAEVSPDVVRVRARMQADGKVSGVTLDATMIMVARFRDGRLSLAWATYDPDAATRAEQAIIKGEPVVT
jgi:ketosteroid isomerase-like protein